LLGLLETQAGGGCYDFAAMPEEPPIDAPVPVDDADIGRVVAGRYRVTRLIGEGGMAVVYEGEHTEIGKRVAIKIVHALYSGDDEIIQRFRREARSASAIESEHIIHVFDAGHDPAVGFYMVMELLKGEDLAKVLQREKQLDPVFACGLAKQAARALEKAHEAGIIHRDLKPANIFLTQRDDGSSQVKVVDFGIAKVIRDANEAREGKNGITRRGMAIGTPQYMSPEQAQGLETIDQRSDVYALGAVLWEAIAGKQLVEERPTYEQTILQILSTNPPRLAEIVPTIPPELDALVAQMLERDVDKRVRDMRDVRERLEAIYPEIRGSSLKLRSVRPPSMALIASASSAATSPAVSLNTLSRRRRSATRWVAVIAAATVVAVAAIVWVEWPSARTMAAVAPSAVISTSIVAPASSASASGGVGVSASGSSSVGASASGSASASVGAGSASAKAMGGRGKVSSGGAAPAATNRPVGGTGISSQF
jgi:serine/threonine protein kinase